MAQSLKEGRQEEARDAKKSDVHILWQWRDTYVVESDKNVKVDFYKSLRPNGKFQEKLIAVIDHSPKEEVALGWNNDSRFSLAIAPMHRGLQDTVPDLMKPVSYCHLDGDTVHQLYGGLMYDGLKVPALVIQGSGPGVSGILIPEGSDAPRLILSHNKGVWSMRPMLVVLDKQIVIDTTQIKVEPYDEKDESARKAAIMNKLQRIEATYTRAESLPMRK
jgi:hypothetical protein